MSGKNDVHVEEEPKDKTQRKMKFLVKNLEEMDRLGREIKISDFGHHCVVNTYLW
jgi:hypothetical protein